MEWISVNERLPKEYEWVMVCNLGYKKATTIGRRIDGKSFQIGRFAREVDYWMPLPEPPEQN